MRTGSAENAVSDSEVHLLLSQLRRLGSMLESLPDTLEAAAVGSQGLAPVSL